MANLSSQDVRAHILMLRDELVENLTMIREAIQEDRRHMQRYFKQFRDFRYRPVLARDTDGNPTEYGTPTEVVLEPLATQFRTTVKSLLDSIRVIEAEILPEDNPEGRDAATTSEAGLSRRASIREDFLAAAGQPTDTALPEPEDHEVARTPKSERTDAIPTTKLVEKPKPTPREPIKAKVTRPETPEPDPIPVAKPLTRPWRDTQPKSPLLEAIRDDAPIEERKSEAMPTPEEPMTAEATPKPKGAVGLSPQLRAQLGAGMSRIGDIKAKYAKKD